MLTCQDTGCLGWSLLSTDQFCSWCGSRLVELEIAFEFKQGEEWIPLVPPVLNRERRPAMRTVVKHVGDAGAVVVKGSHIKSAVPWLGLDTEAVQNTALNPGESLSVAISRLKVPGKEDSVQEARIEVEIPFANGVAPLTTSQVLEFSPPPHLELDLATEEVLLLPDDPPTVDGVLVLKRGHLWLEGPMEFTGTWADLETLIEGEYPCELDARFKNRIPLQLKIRPEVARDMRESAQEGLKRRGSLRLRCLDRGAGKKAAEAGVVLEIPLELGFVLGPELMLAPFPESRRLDWELLQNVTDRRPLSMTISNGPPGTRGRLELTIHDLDIDVDWLRYSAMPELPWRIPSGESLELLLDVYPGHEGTARITFASNDPLTRSYYLRIKRSVPRDFPGWLVVDLGTTNTCAALVDEDRRVEMVGLDAEARLIADTPLQTELQAHQAPETMPSVLCYLELRNAKRYRAGSWAWEQAGHAAAARAVVSGAKRRVGDPAFRFEVVPVDEPAETILLEPREAMRDLYAHAIEKAMEQLARQGRADILLRRSVITHPSRFSMHQIEELKQAVRHAQESHLDRLAPGSGPPEEPATLHEPVGAALHFLNDWRSHAPLHSEDERIYHLLVYDYGGGTLDITLLRVHSQRKPRPGSTNGVQQLHAYCLGKARAEGLEETPELREDNEFQLEQFVQAQTEKVMLTYAVKGATKERVFTRQELLREEDHPYSYTVTPTVLGATGMRWMGGEDVTQVVRNLLVERLAQAVRLAEQAARVDLPLDDTLAGRTNRNTLRVWAEQLKVLLSEGAGEEQLRDTYKSLYFLLDGEERLVPGTSLWKQAGAPSLEEVQEPVRPRLQESVDIIRRLLQAQGLREPDVVLRVGKASKLPAVDEVLRAAFPEARYVTPEEAKECVVKGAATTHLPGRVGSGVQIAHGRTRPTVRVRLGSKQQVLTATTSRLGIKVMEGGKAWFHELVGAGVAIPDEGLEVRLEGVVLQPGLNVLPVLENAGFEDQLGDNPDVETIRQFEILLPEDVDPYDLEDVELRFRVLPDQALKLHLTIPGLPPMEFDTIAATEYGRGY